MILRRSTNLLFLAARDNETKWTVKLWQCSWPWPRYAMSAKWEGNEKGVYSPSTSPRYYARYFADNDSIYVGWRYIISAGDKTDLHCLQDESQWPVDVHSWPFAKWRIFFPSSCLFPLSGSYARNQQSRPRLNLLHKLVGRSPDHYVLILSPSVNHLYCRTSAQRKFGILWIRDTCYYDIF